ncbi:MAG: RsmF rRNA methyltransferase first C-terminal domain-containing protein [Lachnospiraceae bacterium]|nr:RsmF rRNA methyltransferase first C-terminal domain-containing protein [Lachnospiraceae bacterium]
MTYVSENGLVNNLDKEIKIKEPKKLPQEFLNRMQNLLGKEYAEFISGYERERFYGLRYNLLKSGKEEFLRKMPFELTPVKWCEEGFYYNNYYSDKDLCGKDSYEVNYKQPGKHAYHEAGAYYIQEPSAMSVVEVLGPEPGERILDLCAAPGGKTTHIAGKMMGKGLLVTNEIVPDRARILSQNVERMGIANAVVCNEPPERMAEIFPFFFDRVLVDAPCSGEGMFRKEEIAIDMWSPENVAMCAERQLKILESAALMVKAGGVLVYSTCTFSPEENEGVISTFLQQHQEFAIEESALEKFFSQGEKCWIENPAGNIEHTMRLWPHKIEGEGHFIAKLRKADGLNPKPDYKSELKQNIKANVKLNPKSSYKGIQKQDNALKLCRDFLDKELGLSKGRKEILEHNGTMTLFGEQIYLVPSEMIALQGIKVIRPGLHLGTNKKNRFEPSHALALFLSQDEVGNHYEMTDEETEKYLRGETFACGEGLKGWTLLTTGEYSIGFGKAGGGQMKNHYPKGLRRS